MTQLIRLNQTSLYLASGTTREHARAAFLSSKDSASLPDERSLAGAWNEEPAGLYLFFTALPMDDAALAQLFDAVALHVSQRGREGTRFLWIDNPGNAARGLSATGVRVDPAPGDGQVAERASFGFNNMSLRMAAGSAAALNGSGDGFVFQAPAQASHGLAVTRAGREKVRRVAIAGDLRLAFDGGSRDGCFSFELKPDGRVLDLLDVGLRTFLPDPEHAGYVRSLRYPLFDLSASAGANPNLTLNANLDPLAPLDPDRTFFEALAARPVRSFFRNVLGDRIALAPVAGSARLIFAANLSALAPDRASLVRDFAEPLYLTPSGDFEVSVEREEAAAAPLAGNFMCGFSGVEYIKLDLEPATVLRFVAGQSAFSTTETRSISGSDEPVRALKSVTSLATTSWAAFRSGDDSPLYHAQPDQAVLFEATVSSDGNTILEDEFFTYLEIPTAALSSPESSGALAFPLLPYGGIDTELLDDYRQLELQILTPLRRARIEAAEAAGASDGQRLPLAPSGGRLAPVTGTTPQGLLATYSGDYERLEAVQLALDTAGREVKLTSIERGSALRVALQSNQLFMVVTNPAALRLYFTGNQLTIQGWTFDLNPESWSRQGTILIFKFHDKPLVELIENIDSWSLPAAFNGDAKGTQRKLRRLLQEAIENGASADKKLRQKYVPLARAATFEDWAGIIALNVNVPPSNLPAELQGLAAGIDESKFYAQYVGIEATPVVPQEGRLTARQSSLFALIDYRDDSTPLPNDSGYNFQVTLLSVLFRNSQIYDFAAEIAVTLDKLFDEPTALIGRESGRNILALKGTAENHDGVTSYAFSFSGANRFSLPESQTIQTVEIIKAQFTTDPGAATTVTSRFFFWGRLNFMNLEGFDILSFGAESPEVQDNPNFLSFSNLQVVMSFATETPGATTFDFQPRNLAFDMKRGTARAQSLFTKFPLKFKGLTYSENEKTVESLGYMPVKSPLTGGGLGQTWYALTFDLQLGTLGALAGEAGLVVSIIVAWSPGEERNGVFVGLRLPGSTGGKRELTVQGVIKIVFKSIQFVVGEQDGQTSYLLKLKNIKLKFLLLSIPPSGRTEIVIFGDPNAVAGDKQKSVGWYAAYAK